MTDDIAIVGDIHGGIAELQEIVDLVAGRTRELVFVGDYVNRGRASAEVLEYLVRLRESELKSTFLVGNHDIAFLECLRGDGLDRFLQMGGAATIRSYVDSPETNVKAQLLVYVERFLKVDLGLSRQSTCDRYLS